MSGDVSVLLVGGGRMGRALVEGWKACGLLTDQLWVVEPDTVAHSCLRVNHVVTAPSELPAKIHPKIIVFAVKPQNMETIVSYYHCFASRSVFLSVVAGKHISWLTSRLGSTAAIVRAMPNMPAAVRRGITVACGNAALDAASHALCTRLLEAVGSVVWIEEERLLDAVTAVSGSGPAYVFLLAESLARAGHAAGLPAGLAERLAHLTVTGAGELLHHSADSAAILRQNVTSPGGTTAAALAVLMDAQNGLEFVLTRAVAAATARSRELSL